MIGRVKRALAPSLPTGPEWTALRMNQGRHGD